MTSDPPLPPGAPVSTLADSDVFCTFDSEGLCTFFSGVSGGEQSRPRESMLGKPLETVFPIFAEPAMQEALQTALGAGERFELEIRDPHSGCWLAIRIYQTAGDMSVFVTDVTRRKAAEAAGLDTRERLALDEMTARLEKQTKIFETTLSHIADFAYIFDREGRFIYANRPLLELWGMELAQARGKNFFDLAYPVELATRLQNQIQEVFQTRRVVRDETPYVSPSGVNGFYEYIFAPVFGQDGEVEVVAGSTRDITSHKLMHEELDRRVRLRTAELTETNSQLETLVFSIAHDLRAPLRAMEGFAQLLLNDHAKDWEAAPRMYTERIIRSAETLDALTLDLLNYGSISRADIKLEPVAVEHAWRAAMFQHESRIRDTGAVIDVAAPLPHVLAQAATLAQIFANLLGNSLKFVRAGVPPRIRFWAEDHGDRVRLWIADNGTGISPEYHERIFRVFERLHGSSYEGTGIGLSLVRKGVERLQGKVGLESVLGEGTRFWLEFAKAG